MSFKVGDRVRVSYDVSKVYQGKEGIIIPTKTPDENVIWVDLDGETTPTWFVERELERVRSLEIGDRVKVKSHIQPARFADKEGIVRQLEPGSSWDIGVDFDFENSGTWFNADELDLLENIVTTTENKELEDFKAKVIKVALREKGERSWCDEEFYPLMQELGLEVPKPKKYKVTVELSNEYNEKPGRRNGEPVEVSTVTYQSKKSPSWRMNSLWRASCSLLGYFRKWG